MLFNSREYLFFFLGVLALSRALAGLPRARLLFLLAASYYFYASKNGWLIVLILLTTVIDFGAGWLIARSTVPRVRRRWLILAVSANLGLLGFYKYADFLLATAASIASLAGSVGPWPRWDVALPVGISFYTFQTHELHDRRLPAGDAPAERSCATSPSSSPSSRSWSPGPIVRAAKFLPQIGRWPAVDAASRSSARLMLIARGFFKKVVLADFLAHLRRRGRSTSRARRQPHGGLDRRLRLRLPDLLRLLRLHRHRPRLLAPARVRAAGELPPPLRGDELAEFWRRWHISLSSWLRDYLYIPLGGNREATAAARTAT